jgi:O-antigen/teichoic acid export membrane protein
LLTASIYLGVARRHIPWFGVERPARAEVRRFAALSGWSLAGDSLAKLMLASDVLILGVLTSAGMVTSYVLTGYAAQAVVGILTLTLGAAVPGLADVIGRREWSRASVLRADMLAVGWLSATVIGTVILLWNQAFLEMWVGPGHYAGPWSNVLLVLMMVQTVIIRSEASVINAALRIRERVIVSALAALLSCVAAIVLVPWFGIPGLCLSLLGGRLAQSIGFPMIVNASLGMTRSAGWMTSARALTTSAVMFGAAASLGRYLVATTWTPWAIGVLVSMIVTLPAAMYAGLPGASRRAVVLRLQSITSRGGRA